MFCQERPKKPFCSQLCLEAELSADQDKTRQKEFSIPTPRYGIIPEGIDRILPITNCGGIQNRGSSMHRSMGSVCSRVSLRDRVPEAISRTVR